MSKYKIGSCVAVATGGVGESGASSFLLHKATASVQKIVVLRHVDSSLCANTGAAGMLVVNGKPVAQGDISEAGSSIQTQTTVRSGDVVVAIVHTIPKFNEIACIRLGELSVSLDVCELV